MGILAMRSSNSGPKYEATGSKCEVAGPKYEVAGPKQVRLMTE